MAHSAQWFDTDKDGLSKQAQEAGPAKVLVEIVSNALDERFSGVTDIKVQVDLVPGRPYATVVVEDNSPRGYGDFIHHAYTLFAESYKRGNPLQSGQFNFGCKLWLSLCSHASITTTSGTVEFNEAGRQFYPRRKREAGTVVEGLMRMTRSDYDEFVKLMHTLLLPEGVTVTFNGDTLAVRKPIKTFEASLPTKVANDEGVMISTTRKTTVSVYETLPGEAPQIYELGIPVVETDVLWHVRVGQKVPLNKDRDNVTPSYARTLKTVVAEAMLDYLSEKDGKWCQDVLADPNASSATINKILDETEGKNRVVFDPRDQEANARAQAEGATVIPGSRYSKEQWDNIRRTASTPSAGSKYPTAKPWSDDPNAKPADFYDESEWTPGMKRIAEYAQWIAKECVGVSYLGVAFARRMNDNSVGACYGRISSVAGKLEFNMANLGEAWFENGVTDRVNRLLIHELAHQLVGSHFNKEATDYGNIYFYDACCWVGAKLAELALRSPERMREFR